MIKDIEEIIYYCAITEAMDKKKEEAAAVPTTKICPECASEIPIKAKRCPNCTSVIDK